MFKYWVRCRILFARELNTEVGRGVGCVLWDVFIAFPAFPALTGGPAYWYFSHLSGLLTSGYYFWRLQIPYVPQEVSTG